MPKPEAVWDAQQGCYLFGPDDSGPPRDKEGQFLCAALAKCPLVEGDAFDPSKHVRCGVDQEARKARLRREALAKKQKALTEKQQAGPKKAAKRAHPQDRLKASGF